MEIQHMEPYSHQTQIKMPECEKQSSIQDSTVSSPSDPMVIDVGPPAAEEKSIEQPMQPRPKPSPQAEGNATEASPKAKKRGRPASGKAESTNPSDGGPSGKNTKAQLPRKSRAKKSKPTTEDEPPAHSISALPSPLDSPKPTLPKQAASRHTGRQHAGPYTQEEVRALQTWVNNSIKEDWNTIVQEVGKATGVYRNVDNLRTFYGTVVLRQMYGAFPDKDGRHGSIVAVDVGVGDSGEGGEGGEVGKVCGNCKAILIEGTRDEEVEEKVAAENTEDLRPTGEPMQIEAELTGRSMRLSLQCCEM